MCIKKIPVLIDVDTGVDDALALTAACACPQFDIIGVTTVAGNVDLKYTTKNTMNVLHLLGRDDIPVAAGAAGPLERPLVKASAVHGLEGLRGFHFEEDYTDCLVDEDAVTFIWNKLKSQKEKVTIIALAPLTNIASLILAHEDCGQYIEKIIFMGTSYHDGNPSPIVTFNVLVDPEALKIVLGSKIPFCAVPLDVTRQCYLTPEEIGSLEKEPGIIPGFAHSILTHYGTGYLTDEEREIIGADSSEEQVTATKTAEEKARVSLHDPATVAYAACPDMFTAQKYFAMVECKGEITTGFTLIDKRNFYAKRPEEMNVLFVESVDRERMVNWFISAVKSYK